MPNPVSWTVISIGPATVAWQERLVVPFGPSGQLRECVSAVKRITRRVRGVTRMTAAVRSRWWSGVPPDAMLPPRNANGGHEMYKLLSDLGQAVLWIWMTPEEARQLLRQRSVAPQARDARSDYATAA
jgi:hypothetical protein